MASTYVNDLRLNEMATGDGSGTWGTTTNTNLELIGEAVSYATQESFGSDANATTTVADGAADPARAFYFKVTSSGSLTATRVLTIAPNDISRIQIIENATSGSQIITIKQGTGATVNIPTGESRMVYYDGAGGGAAVVDALADINIGGKVTVGVDDTGYDVKFFGATSGKYWLWDESADGVLQYSTLTVGVDDTGYDVKFFGATSGNYMLWDESADSLLVNGDIDMVTNGNRIDLDTDNDTSIRASADDTITIEVGGSDLIALTTTSTFSCPVTVGVNDTGHDVKFFGATSGKYILWDESDDALIIPDSTNIKIGTGNDLQLYHDGSDSYIKNATGALKLATETSGIAVTIGHTTSETTVADNLTVTGDIDVDGTTNLDAVDIDGNVQIDGTLSVGVDDTGKDVKFFGATSGKYMLWDESDDSLNVPDSTKIKIGTGSDMALYHNGTDNYLDLTNDLRIRGGGSDMMYFQSTGNIYMGGLTSEPQNGYLVVKSNAGKYSIVVGGGSTDTFTALAFTQANDAVVGTVAISSSSTAYNTTSDYRIKENVVDLENATARLNLLKPYRFNFIGQTDTVDGFYAHEVSNVVHEAITGAKDAVDDNGNDILQGIDQSKLVPLLVATIQELEARITALES